MPSPPVWTHEKCRKDAQKYKTIMEWVRNSGGAHAYARRHNILDECYKHMIRIGDKDRMKGMKIASGKE